VSRFRALNGKGLLFLLFLWFLWFMNFTIRTILSPLLPLIEDEFLVNHAKASSIFPLISFGYAISLLLSTLFAGLLGTKKSIALSFLIAGAAVVCVPFAQTFTVLYVLVFLMGLGVGLYLPNAIPVITDCYPETHWGRALSIHETATSISIFSAPFLALLLLSWMDWRAILVLLGSVCLMCGAFFPLVGHDVKVTRSMTIFPYDLLKNRALWIIGVIWIFAAGSNLGLYFVTPLYFVKELGMSEGYANGLLGASRLGGVVTAISVGFIVDRFSLRKTASLLIFATGITTIGLAAPNQTWIKADLFLQAAVSTAFFPLSLVTISRMFAPEARGPATAFIVMLGVVFGVGIGPYLLGVCGDLISFRFGIVVLGCVTAASSFLFRMLRGLQ
jgi:MFS family permease